MGWGTGGRIWVEEVGLGSLEVVKVDGGMGNGRARLTLDRKGQACSLSNVLL